MAQENTRESRQVIESYVTTRSELNGGSSNGEEEKKRMERVKGQSLINFPREMPLIINSESKKVPKIPGKQFQLEFIDFTCNSLFPDKSPLSPSPTEEGE